MKEKILSNPITKIIKDCIIETTSNLKIAVPFVNFYAKEIIDKNNTQNIKDKRLVIKFEDKNINTFDLPTLEYLLGCGFKICYNNKIHLKLYITDNNIFVTSSNLTKGGFESNLELTVNVDSQNYEYCEQVFDNLWMKSKKNKITIDLINENRDKYEVLKKRQKFEKLKVIEIKEKFYNSKLDIEKLTDKIFYSKDDYSWVENQTYEANKIRNKIKSDIKTKKFDTALYYSPIGSANRNHSLFYNFVYGIESKLAGTGLREAQFQASFDHRDFKKVIDFIIPESIGLEPWNLSDKKNMSKFCNGLFDFDIPQYSEVIPIRLASYFYPEYFQPIFKLNHLREVCETLGIETEAKTKGDRFYAYNQFLNDKMADISHNNYIKSRMVYQLRYCIELYNRIESGEEFKLIRKSYDKKWIRDYLDIGKLILESIDTTYK